MSFVRRYQLLQGFSVSGDFESRSPAADLTERAIIL